MEPSDNPVRPVDRAGSTGVEYDLAMYKSADKTTKFVLAGSGIGCLMFACGLLIQAHPTTVSLALNLSRGHPGLGLLLFCGIGLSLLTIGLVSFADPAHRIVIAESGFTLSYAWGKPSKTAWVTRGLKVQILDYRQLPNKIGSGLRILTGWGSRSYLSSEAFDALLESAKSAGCKVEIQDQRRDWGCYRYLIFQPPPRNCPHGNATTA